MDVEQLRQLVSQPRETAKVDFKIQFYKISEPKPLESAAIQKWKDTKDQQWAEIVKDILALTNGNIGTVQQTAYLIIGSDDKLKADGTPNLQDVGNQVPTRKDIYEKVNSYCEPRIPNLDCETIGLDNQRLFVISIPPSPYVHKLSKQLKTPKKDFSPHTVLLRRGDGEETYEASDEEKKALQQEKNYFFEKQTVFQRDLDELVREVRSRCCSKILTTYNHIQLYTLKQIELDQLFVPVFVSQEPSNQRESRQSPPPSPALEIVKRHQYLMILGKPGAGKSTFVTYLVTTCCKNESETDWIPVLLRLSEVDTRTPFKLLDALGTAFGTEIDITQQILKGGKVFLILDGLDEVSSQFRQDLCQEISNFVTSPYANKVVITCRTDVKDYKLPSVFERVEIADFGRQQQNQFIGKWFDIADQDPTSWLAIRLQQHPECTSQMLINQVQQNERLQELAKTPILLSLICLVYVSDGNLPEKRSSLYERGLEILLEDWDRDRGIKKERVESKTYQSLSSDDKRKILAELARYTFDQAEDTIAFEQATALEIITKYRHYSPQESLEILEGIAADHGLVFRSTRRKWEFSHLTFQEYFVAQWFVRYQAWKTLTKNVCNPRWREAFLLVSEMADPADRLLILLKHRIDELLVEDNKLQKFLQWVDEKAAAAVDLDQAPYKYVACRAFYISELDLIHPLDPKLSEDFAIDFEPSVNPDVERAYHEQIALWEEERMRRIDDPTWEPPTPAKHEPYVQKIALNPYLYLDYQLPDWLENTKDGETAVHSLEQNCRFHLEFPPFAIDPQLHQKLQALCVQFKEYRDEDWDYWMRWWQDNGQVWVNQLRTAMIEHRNIGHDWQFNDSQKEKLQHYCDANKLLVDCLNSDCYVSREVRQEIEETLLLPISNIQARKS